MNGNNDIVKIVLIEDEPAYANALRSQITEAITIPKKRNVELWPPESYGRPTYPSMEAFMSSPQGGESETTGFFVVDLFLATGSVNPLLVFQQLMYTIYISPTDFSLVCGRLGVLEKLINSYKNAHVEVYSYFPTYFSRLYEAIPPDEDFCSKEMRGKIKRWICETENAQAFKRFLDENLYSATGETSGIELLKLHALRQAIVERLEGIVNERDANLTAARHRAPLEKSDEVRRDVDQLIKTINAYLDGKGC